MTLSNPAAQSAAAIAEAPALYVLYGTESGNAKIVAYEAVKAFAGAGLAARAFGLNEIAPTELTKIRQAVFVVSTAGDGDMPYNAIDFWEALSADDYPRIKQLHYGVIALGESIYEDFCAAGIKMDERLHQLGGTRIADRITCDYDFEVHAATWIEQSLALFARSIASNENDKAAEVVITVAAGSGRPVFAARVTQKRVLTRAATDREVIHYQICLQPEADGLAPFDWQPGDSINVRYGNDPALADAILECLCLDQAVVPAGHARSLRAQLIDDFDVRLISRDFVQAVGTKAGSAELQEILEGSHDDFAVWRETNDLLQLLLDHPTARFSADELLSLLRPLQPRAYSIASSPAKCPTTIELSVRTVAYSGGDRMHFGVVSGGLSRRAEADHALVVQHLPTPSFRLPDDPSADIVMVGAGVGVAPFRAFLQHREALGHTGRNWLFHGIRNPEEDELYAQEFAEWRANGLLTNYEVCASRIAQGRRYVQDGMRERGPELFDLLKGGGYFYVCGDAHHMAKAVRSSLREIAAEALGSSSDGEFFVEGLQAGRRYRQDVY